MSAWNSIVDLGLESCGGLVAVSAWGADRDCEVHAVAVRATVADAAAPYRRSDGSYRFENVFRVVVARAWRGSYRLR